MTNPNPSRITEPMWRMWTERPVSTWKLGGIYANKSGYHNTVDANKKTWPGNYSIRVALDLTAGPKDRARAIDYTMSDAEMKRRTGYLVAAASKNDPRLAAVREFYGTTNGTTVVGRSKDDRDGPWRSSTSDPSHLWHIHISFFTAFVNTWSMLEPVLSVLRGETLAQWQARKGGVLMLPKQGATGEEVKFWQRVLEAAGYDVGAIDGVYGTKMAAAVNKFRAAHKLGTDDEISGWSGFQLMMEVFKGQKGDPGKIGPAPTAEQLAAIISAWAAEHRDELIPVNAVEQAVTTWLQAHANELRGEPGKTPTEVTFTGIVTKTE